MSQIFARYGDKTMPVPAGMTLEQLKAQMSRFFPELSEAKVETKKDGDKTTYVFSKQVGTKGSASLIMVESYLSSSTLKGNVKLSWGNQIGELTPDQARAHARLIMECAEAAEQDEFLFTWLYSIGVEDVAARVEVLKQFREYRDTHGQAH